MEERKKVTIRYMDDSTSTLEVDGDDLTLSSTDEYFTIEDENEQAVGWIVRENVKYVVIGELIDKFNDAKYSTDDDRNKDRDGRSY